MPYDSLIVSTGAGHSYLGNDGWEAHAPGLKTLEDALEIRRRALLAFEQAERQEDPEDRRRWLTFVVIGGGPTGVEMAGRRLAHDGALLSNLTRMFVETVHAFYAERRLGRAPWGQRPGRSRPCRGPRRISG